MRGTRLKGKLDSWRALRCPSLTQNGETEVRRLLSDNIMSPYKSTVNFQEKHMETRMQ